MFGFVDYFIFSVFGGLVALDIFTPARKFPLIPQWRLKGLLAAILYYVVASYSPFLWDEWLGQYRLIDATGLPFYVAAPLALLVYQLGIYAWHRTMHAVPLLWRVFHQTHHSAERVDIWGALYFHPLDVVGFSLVGSLALTLLLGVSPDAVLFAILVSSFCGTFRNPKTWDAEAGFYDGASARTWEALTFRKIDIPASGPMAVRAAGAGSLAEQVILLIYVSSLSIPFFGLGLAIAPAV